MAFEQRELSGSLFKNDRREKDTHPNMTGTALINGVEYWVSAWTREGKSGKWISLAFKPKVEKRPDGSTKRNPGKLDENDDVPF
jgi:hypothetical protein